MQLNGIMVDNFKSYGDMTQIPISSLSILMGANSSGKSTALQTLLALKQTIECNSPDVDLLLSGKYVTLGDFADAINNLEEGYFSFGVSVVGDEYTENYSADNLTDVVWKFCGSTKKDVSLAEITFRISNEHINVVKTNDDLYSILINGEDTALTVKINNLLLTKLYVNYNTEFNNIFYNFINEIVKLLLPQKKSSSFEKNEIVSLRTVEKFYFELMRRGVSRTIEQDEEDNSSNIINLVNRIVDIIEDYCKCQFKYYANFEGMTRNFRENDLFNCIYNHNNIENIEKILVKYEKQLGEIRGKEYLHNCDGADEFDINMIYQLGSEEKGINSECDIISDAFRVYKGILNRIIRKIFYLGPIREKPQGLYNVGFETIPKYVGTTGAYFASVLLRENKIREYILPNNEVETMSLLEALDEWAIHLNVASEIKVEKKNSFGFSVSVFNTQRQKADIMNVGIGTSQVLPVLITGLLSESGEYLLFEQPELHLHPYSQSRLADFFVELVKQGRKIIVETHSEYFVLRMRYQILVNGISENDIVINFFQNKGRTRISQGKLSGYGNLQYPEDFRDETQKLLDDLMNAALEKRGQ